MYIYIYIYTCIYIYIYIYIYICNYISGSLAVRVVRPLGAEAQGLTMYCSIIRLYLLSIL